MLRIVCLWSLDLFCAESSVCFRMWRAQSRPCGPSGTLDTCFTCSHTTSPAPKPCAVLSMYACDGGLTQTVFPAVSQIFLPIRSYHVVMLALRYLLFFIDFLGLSTVFTLLLYIGTPSNSGFSQLVSRDRYNEHDLNEA